MHNILEEIIKEKHKEVKILKSNLADEFDYSKAKQYLGSKSLKQSITSNELSFIGEIKRRSPSKGHLSHIPDPSFLLKEYLKGGVSAVSVLTDKKFFSGSIEDLKKISHQLRDVNTPILRKDFIIDKAQIVESILSGANAILLIVSILKEKTGELLAIAKELGIDAIVEVHNRAELDFAVSIGSEIIGINNRDLHTFSEDINVCLKLAKHVPEGILKIAESAIKSPEDIRKVNAAGFDAVLIGEALVKSEKPSSTLKEMRSVLDE